MSKTMSKKDKPNLLTIPCHRNGCGYVSVINLSDFDYYEEENRDRYKLQSLKRAIQKLISGHESGKHAQATCCHCHHLCPCERFACRELAL